MLVLLVNNDESDILKGGKDGRSCTNDKIHITTLDSCICIKALTLGERGMDHRYSLSVPTAE